MLALPPPRTVDKFTTMQNKGRADPRGGDGREPHISSELCGRESSVNPTPNQSASPI